MSPIQRHIKSQFNTNYEEPYATISEPTNATIIPKKIMENDEEKKNLRQKSKIIYFESKLAKNKKTKGQKET